VKILIVDDEALARDRLAALLGELGQAYRVIGKAANGQEAIELMHRYRADLVLMDIRMPGMDGIRAAEILMQSETPPAVIFTTAYEEHALQAFESQAVDYLLKPVRRARLSQALARAQRLTLAQLEAITARKEQPVPQLSVSYRGGLRRVSLDQVIYLRAESKYVTARYQAGELLLEESLKSLESRYKEWFLRVHRNALVARNALVGLERVADAHMRVRLRGCSELIEVSRRHLPNVRRWLKDVG
jgi:two-component system response regulator AlgR